MYKMIHPLYATRAQRGSIHRLTTNRRSGIKCSQPERVIAAVGNGGEAHHRHEKEEGNGLHALTSSASSSSWFSRWHIFESSSSISSSSNWR